MAIEVRVVVLIFGTPVIENMILEKMKQYIFN